jgi:hypothetical protein
MVVKVRPLCVNDLFAVAKIISKAAGEGVKALSGMQGASEEEVGLAVVTIGIGHAEDETKAWLADLIGKTPEEFGKMPPTAALDIVDQLADQEDLRAFFSKAGGLAKKLGGKK